VISNFSPSKKLQYHPTVNIISLLKSCVYRLKKTTSIASGYFSHSYGSLWPIETWIFPARKLHFSWIFHFHQPSYCRVNITSPNISAAFSGPWGFMRKGPMYLAVQLGNDEKIDWKWWGKWMKMMFMKFYERNESWFTDYHLITGRFLPVFTWAKRDRTSSGGSASGRKIIQLPSGYLT